MPVRTGPASEETTLDEARAVFETNLFGVVRVTNAVLPYLRAGRRGRIINVGSAAAWVGEPGEGFYAASKHALAGYTEALRHEVWPLGIGVSLVEPGAFGTNVLDAASASAGRLGDYDQVREAASRTLRESLRRGGDPRKVARLVSKVARARAPRLRYPVGWEGMLVAVPAGAAATAAVRPAGPPRVRVVQGGASGGIGDARRTSLTRPRGSCATWAGATWSMPMVAVRAWWPAACAWVSARSTVAICGR